MKVFIGPYVNWIGPYQIAGWLQHVGVSEERCHELGEKLANTWVKPVCEWIHGHQHRKVKVKLHRYDTWNMDSTLSHIVLPMLKQLHATKHGAPSVDDEDVPEHLRSTSAPPRENEWDTDENHFKRFDWLLEELIWTFEQLHPECDGESKFFSGDSDIQFNKIEGSDLYSMDRGPKDTFKMDQEGLNAYKARIQKGCELFGKYLQGLWD
jgi:hypothetical protein